MVQYTPDGEDESNVPPAARIRLYARAFTTRTSALTASSRTSLAYARTWSPAGADPLSAITPPGATASGVIPGPRASHSWPSEGLRTRLVGHVAKNRSGPAPPPAKN